MFKFFFLKVYVLIAVVYLLVDFIVQIDGRFGCSYFQFGNIYQFRYNQNGKGKTTYSTIYFY